MSTLGDVIVESLQELIRVLFSPISEIIERQGPALLNAIVSTPHPNAVFSRPTNGAWPAIFDYYWGTLVPLSLLLWGLSVGLVILLESTSHLFSGYHRSKLKKRAVSGLLGVLGWWWLAAFSLRFTDALTGFLVPSLAEISLFQTLSFGTMGVLGLAVSLTVDLVLFALIGLIYFTRQVALFLFVLLMPILIVLWIPGLGPFGLASRFMKRLAGFYVPFLFMTVPVALLFRLGDLLGTSFGLSMSGIGAWLIALVIPIVAVASPFFLFWQAGALLFMGDRMARHVSTERAHRRTASARARAAPATQAGRDFSGGLRGRPPMGPDGQYLLDSGQSTAHAAGSRLRSKSRELGSSVRSAASSDDPSSTAEPPTINRTDDFDTLRNRPSQPRNSPRSPGRVDDDRPRYID